MDKEHHIEQEQLEEIERFLQQHMTEDERHTFLARLVTDDMLRKRTDELRLLFLGVQETSLQERLNYFHQELTAAPAAGKKSQVGYRWLAAASIITALAVSCWWLFFKPAREEALYAEFFQPDPGLISVMGNSDNYIFDRAMIDYKTGNYETAIRTWDSLLAVHPGNDTLNYFLGSAYMAAKQTGKAIDHFRKVEASANSVFRKEAAWYWGLALLNEGNIRQAIPLLERSGHSGKDALLTRLKQILPDL